MITEGYMPFMGYQTYYRIVGEASEKAPLLLLHGGPGSTHNYFEVLDCIAETGRQIISYDQIGCGHSYLDGHPELWTQKTWIDELIAIREHLHLDSVHLLGQSWGANGTCSATRATHALSMPTRSIAKYSPTGWQRTTSSYSSV